MDNRIQHSVDAAYTATIEEKLADGIAEERSKLSAATLSVGRGFLQTNMNCGQ
ncbi:MAG TPA: hypothetical protein PLL71_01175 [Agriterribacter sp.]|nr:hypothetical protein [Agriterribacter sp.]